MFNNNLDWLEELIAGHDADAVLENRAEDFHDRGPIRSVQSDQEYLQSRVDSLLWAYRDVGYLYANLNPLGESYSERFTSLSEVRSHVYHRLTLEEFGLSEADLNTRFFPGRAIGGKMPLRDIIDIFKATYCSYIGVEFLHIQNRAMREWLTERFETTRNKTEMSVEQKKIVLEDLVKTEEFEHFLHKTFMGQRRFSIEGAEALIPALHFIVDNCPRYNIKHISLGTTHRGRLTILNLILEKSLEDIFYLFEPNYLPGMYGGSGDVKYHIGYSGVHKSPDGNDVTITLSPNASHLESVGPVVEGKARGTQDSSNDRERKKVLPILVHGEAAFSGQGVVAETFNLSQLEGYSTGGTIHIIVNNQIGFTTPARFAHSNLNPTDIAKMLPVPVFHVNGDVPEAVLHVMRLALDFRQTFGRDVVVDVFSYRRHGHNEGDEPSFTHPYMYELIEKHQSVTALYSRECLASNIVTGDELARMKLEFTSALASALVKEREHPPLQSEREKKETSRSNEVNTGIDSDTIGVIVTGLTTIPPGMHVHQKLVAIIKSKLAAWSDGGFVDWAFAEAIAFGSLLLEGIPVRLSGEDSERGTFSQRHLVWWDVVTKDAAHYVPLNNLRPGQELIAAYDSPLAEFSVLGFEYGYASAYPRTLVMWEAQFGDFSNGAQVVIDNYIVPAESKWGALNGIVLLLPHGFEGQGPEHSSAHLERFLQLCADENVRVANPSTPAQYFHLLRSQAKDETKKPLVIMTPKSLLRHALAVSTGGELVSGKFKTVLGDPENSGAARVPLFCSGKIYYDLLRKKREEKRDDVALVRVEQLYPFPASAIREELGKYAETDRIIWVQEEPRNRGAWNFMREQLGEHFPGMRVTYVGRKASASPAVGSLKLHNAEQARILDEAFDLARQKDAKG